MPTLSDRGTTGKHRVVRRWVLAQRPSGAIDDGVFRIEETRPADVSRGQARVVPLYLSLDPAMRGWLDDRPSYAPPVPLGGVMRARGVGRVTESRSDDPALREGNLVVGPLGWAEEVVVEGGTHQFRAVSHDSDREIRGELGILGNAGLTAWVGVDISDPRAGKTFVVSAAAGAVGSIAGQLAKKRGARVVGIAGGVEKCAVLTERLSFDAAVDYRAPDWREQLAAATPNGVDAVFENVGGEVFEAVIDRMNDFGRIALCGLVSTYNDPTMNSGPANFRQFVPRRILTQGFIVLDHLDELEAAREQLRDWLATDEICMLETVIDGFENLPAALASLFAGRNTGKMVVRLAD